MLVQSMVGNTCCELCGQTRFVHSFLFQSIWCGLINSIIVGMGDTIRMQGAYRLPLSFQKEKTFTEIPHSYACQLGREAEFVGAMA